MVFATACLHPPNFFFLLKADVLFLSIKLLGVKGFCEIFLSLRSDGVRNNSKLTNLHIGLIFDMRVVFIKLTRIFSHFVFEVFFLAND